MTVTRRTRGAGRLAGVAAMALAGSLVAGPASSTGPSAAPVDLRLDCRFGAAGNATVTAQVRTQLPAAARAGGSVQPSGVELTVTVPRAATALPTGAVRVSAKGALRVRAVQGTGGADMLWAGLTGPDVDSASGDVKLRLAGKPAPVSSTGAGLALFLAEGLNLELSSVPASGTGAAHAVPTLARVVCALAKGQPGVLGVVPVTGARGRAGRLSVSSRSSAVYACPPAPTGSLDPSALPVAPPTASVFPVSELECAFAVGWSNVAKQKSATLINDPSGQPALTVINSVRVVMDYSSATHYFELDSVGSLHLPPARATFLTFGFMPITAVLHFEAVSPLTVVSLGTGEFDTVNPTTISGYQELRVSDVKVNGVPLDVGPDCRTQRPIHLRLVGENPIGPNGETQPDSYTVTSGGPLYQRDLYIPPFTGCGTHGENLDALFTASVSGPGNSLNFLQGPACLMAPPTQGCTPVVVPGIPTAVPPPSTGSAPQIKIVKRR